MAFLIARVWEYDEMRVWAYPTRLKHTIHDTQKGDNDSSGRGRGGFTASTQNGIHQGSRSSLDIRLWTYMDMGYGICIWIWDMKIWASMLVWGWQFLWRFHGIDTTQNGIHQDLRSPLKAWHRPWKCQWFPSLATRPVPWWWSDDDRHDNIFVKHFTQANFLTMLLMMMMVLVKETQ